MTEEQEIELRSAFKAAVSLSFADSDEENKMSCCSFDMKAFHPYWDKKTLDEVKYHVQLYSRTWIVAPLERAFGLKVEDVNDEMMLNWHQKQVDILKAKIRNKK